MIKLKAALSKAASAEGEEGQEEVALAKTHTQPIGKAARYYCAAAAGVPGRVNWYMQMTKDCVEEKYKPADATCSVGLHCKSTSLLSARR